MAGCPLYPTPMRDFEKMGVALGVLTRVASLFLRSSAPLQTPYAGNPVATDVMADPAVRDAARYLTAEVRRSRYFQKPLLSGWSCE